ncbi:MAG: hypothetical protein AB1440_04390 [Pseudomonadota bacterium]|jgi:hypothetical protein
MPAGFGCIEPATNRSCHLFELKGGAALLRLSRFLILLSGRHFTILTAFGT